MESQAETPLKLTSTYATLEEKAKDLDIKYILPVVSSFVTDCRGCLVPSRSAESLENNGFGILMVDHVKMELSDPEQYGIADPDTLIKLPWQPDVGWVACNVHHKGVPSPQCPRLKLAQLQRRAKQMRLIMKCGVEPEFILLKKDKHEELNDKEVDMVVYHKPQHILERIDFIHECLDTMDRLGWQPYQAEHEAISNQYELNFGYAEAMTSANRHFFMKFMIKELALKHGYRASFMPAPFPGKPMGSGLHLNLSLWSVDEDKNLFPDDSSPIGLSAIAQHFTAGIIAHARALTAVLCPTVNSYKRLHASTYSSTGPVVSWAVESRFPMIRIPANNRIELRIGDGSGNPYLIHAAVLAAGLDGVKHKLPLEESTRMQEDMTKVEPAAHLQQLPKTLDEACQCLLQDTVLTEWLGKPLVEGFVHMKRREWKDFMRMVTPWEIQRADEY